MPPYESYRDDYAYRVDDGKTIKYNEAEYNDESDDETYDSDDDNSDEMYSLKCEEVCIYSNLKQANKDYSHHCSFFYSLTFLTIGFSGLTYISLKPTIINISLVGVVATFYCAYLTELYFLNKERREYEEKYDKIQKKYIDLLVS
jgi:hypothetical protein